MAKERKARRHVIANPDEPRAGQYDFSYYKSTHPVTGNRETIKNVKKELRGLRGHRVTMWVNGWHTSTDDPENPVHFRLKRVFNFRKYDDAFGPGSAYHSAIKYIRDQYSDDQLGTTSITFEVADDDEEDSEEGL